VVMGFMVVVLLLSSDVVSCPSLVVVSVVVVAMALLSYSSVGEQTSIDVCVLGGVAG
jgi:hypothetical protein